MKMQHRMTKSFAALCTLLLAANCFAYRELDILPQQQSYDSWCWAACCSMVLIAYDTAAYQSTIANWAVGGLDVGNELTGCPTCVDEVLKYFGGIWCNPTLSNSQGYGNLMQRDVCWEIDDGKPFLAIWNWIGTPVKHALLVRGYTGSGGSDAGYIIYNEPDDGSRKVKSYAEFVQNGNYSKWQETLRLITPPHEPIPLGIGDNHAVRLQDDSCTQEITQSPQSLSFQAIKAGDSPVSWEWNLVFPHEYGEAVVASWNTDTTQAYLTWNIAAFSLPTNYDWKYSYDGKIGGRVEVVCMDPDYHDDAINVIYVPDDLYPGVLIYEDNTVNNVRPDVRAHELLIVRNDHFQPGADIALMAGERIDIEDGVTIENGSITSIMIDPLLR